MFDVLITNATIVDGSGNPARRGHVGVRDGLITAVADEAEGVPEGSATETVDADGLVVCPGFIDPHTHYDAQLAWDPTASPSNTHGVTTIIAGNCGFTLAPVVEADRDYTARMMSKVEGMPLAALAEGVDWSWSSFGEYLDRLDGAISVNAGFLVGHCALRRRVMGADSVGSEATPEQLDAMQHLLAECLRAGGLGFSTTQARTHSDGDGKPVASRWATRDELMALARVVADHPGTTLEYASDGCLDGFSDDDVQFMIDFSLAGQRPVNWNVLTVDSAAPERYRNQIDAMERVAAAGARAVALTMPTLVGMNMSFGTFCALNLLPEWGGILGLPLDVRMDVLRVPSLRRHLAARADSPDAGVFRRLTGWDRYVIGDTYSAANEGLSGRRIGDLAAERGQDPFDTLLDVVLEDNLRTVLWPGPTDDDDESWRLRAAAWQHPAVMIGGSDAGAHLDRMCGAPYTTEWLGDCLRGKQLTTLEDAVRHLTDVPARLFGLTGRGRIAEGNHADLVLFDPATIGAGEIRLVNDLPGNTGRLVADAIGVERVMVGGVTTVDGGEPTAARPGRVLRSGRDTETVQIPAALGT